MKDLFETTDPNNNQQKSASNQRYVYKPHLQIDTHIHSWISEPSAETLTSDNTGLQRN